MDLSAAKDMFDLDYIIFRPHNVYGEYQNIGYKYRNVVGIFMNHILNEEPLTIFGDGKQKGAFSYVKDIIPPIASAPWTDGACNRVFNVGTETPYSVNELAKEVAEVMGAADHPVTHLESRSEVDVVFSDHSVLKDVFGEQSETPLRKGLQKIARWVKKVGARNTPHISEVQINKNMPKI